MAASKLKNRRRFITRDVRLDIPEDQELTISPLGAATDQYDSLSSAYDLNAADASLYDRTWPRRTWRPSSDFAKSFIGLQQQNAVVNSTLTLPRFHHGGVRPSTSALQRSDHGIQPQPPPGDCHANGNASPSSSADTRWRFRSLSDVVSSTCLSAASSPSETVSEPCFKTNCHDSAVYDAGSISSRNSNVSSPRDLATTFALGSIPELGDDDDDDTSIFGLETKRRSHSLNESSSYRPFFNHLRSNRSPQPGSVLHRALTWEMAGKSQPFRVTVSPISDTKGQEGGFRRNVSTDKLNVIHPPLGFDPSNSRGPSSIWKSVDPATQPWTKEGMAIGPSSEWNSVDPASKPWEKEGERMAISFSRASNSLDLATKPWPEPGERMEISSSSAWNSSDPATKSWTKKQEGLAVNSSVVWKSVSPVAKSLIKEEGVAIVDQDKTNHLSSFTTSLKNSRDDLRTDQMTWNSVNSEKQKEQAREMTCNNLGNGYDLGRLDHNAIGDDDNGFRATEFRTPYRVSPVKTSRSFTGSTHSRNKTEDIFVGTPNTFRDRRSDDLDTSNDFHLIPLAKKPFNGGELYRDDNNYSNASCENFPDQSISTGRKPVRSKSLRLLSSESTSFPLARDAGFLRPLSDWKADAISLSTPNSPLSTPAEGETAPEYPVIHSLTLPSLSMVALNTEPENHNLRSTSNSQSATSLLGKGAPQNKLSTWGPFVVKDFRKSVTQPVALTSLCGQRKPDSIKPFESKFVVRRITNLAKNPFSSISTIVEDKKGGIKPDQSVTTTCALNDENTGKQFEKENHSGQNPTRLELEKSKQDLAGVEFAYSGHDTIAMHDKNRVPWPEIPAWNGSSKTQQDDVSSPYNCDSVAPPKDNGYKGSTSESSPTVTSERLTVHLAEPGDPSMAEEDQVVDWCNDSSMPLVRNPNKNNGEHCSRHIRVFLKSSSQLQDEACVSHIDKSDTKAVTEIRNIDTKWTTEVPKTQSDIILSSDRSVEAGNETDVKEKDLAKAPHSAIAKYSGIAKDTAKAKDSACLTAEISPKVIHPEYWHQKTEVNKSPPLLNNGENCFKTQQKQNEEAPLLDWNTKTFSTGRPVAASKCHIEIKGSDAGLKKPFEIVKRKLIIPEAMSWFSSREDKSKQTLKQDPTSQNERNQQSGSNRDVRECRSEDRQTDVVRLFGTVHKGTDAPPKSLLVTDALGNKSNRSVKDGTTSYMVNGPSTTSCDRPGRSKTNVPDNISIIPSNKSFTFDTGISICKSIVPDRDYTNINDNTVTLGDVSERGLEKSVNGLDGDVLDENELDEDAIYRQADDVLSFLNNWTDAADSGKKCETTSVNFLSNGKATLLDSGPQSSSILEDEETREFHANVDCSIMTELDQAIEMLTAPRTLQSKTPPTGLHTSPGTTKNGPASLESSLRPWEGISRKLTQAFSDQVNRKTTACPKVPPAQEKVQTTVSTALNCVEQKPVVSFSSFHTSCKPIAPIQVLRLSQNDVERMRVTAATDKRNQWMILAREDSFNRPDSPLFRKTLPLPKDSVIMRHRLHQKELGCSGGGGAGAGSLSSSESSDDEASPVAPRVAPRRTKKSRSISVEKGVVPGIEEASGDDDGRNGERDSIASSTTSLRPVSLDSSFLSEDNM